MRIRLETKNLMGIIGLIMVVAACGRQPDSAYDEEEKNYGQAEDAQAIPAISQPTISQPGTVNSVPTTITPVTDLGDGGTDGGDDNDSDGGTGEDDTDETGNDTGDGGDSDDGGIIGDDGEGDDASDIADPPDIPPETLLSSNWYRAFFDLDSAYGIRDGVGIRNLGQMENRVKDKLTTIPSDGLVVSQTFGDGVSTSLNSQDIYNSAADENREPGTSSVSGTQFMDRIVTQECPGVLLCISRMWFVPLEGDAVTYCFQDPDSGDAIPFPYGPLPNYKAADFDSSYGVYGPYQVTKHAGVVSCDNPGETLLTETIHVDVFADAIDNVAYELHVFDPVAPDFAVSFRNSRVNGDMESPYIDETIQFNLNSKYMINETIGDITKMVVTSRQSIDVAAEAGGGVFGRLIANLLNIQGIIVDLHFELCTNLLDADSAPYCEAPYGPVIVE